MQIKRLYQQFCDIAPHLARLLPILERVVTGTSFTAGLAGGAVAAEVDLSGVHGHLDEMSKANTALLRQLQDQTLQIAGVEEEVKRLRMALEHTERRLESAEREIASVGMWVKALGGIAVVLLVIIAVMIYILHAH